MIYGLLVKHGDIEYDHLSFRIARKENRNDTSDNAVQSHLVRNVLDELGRMGSGRRYFQRPGGLR
jgi:hypothetical protein